MKVTTVGCPLPQSFSSSHPHTAVAATLLSQNHFPERYLSVIKTTPKPEKRLIDLAHNSRLKIQRKISLPAPPLGPSSDFLHPLLRRSLSSKLFPGLSKSRAIWPKITISFKAETTQRHLHPYFLWKIWCLERPLLCGDTVTVTPGEFHPQESPVSDDRKKKKISLKLRFSLTCSMYFEALECQWERSNSVGLKANQQTNKKGPTTKQQQRSNLQTKSWK